jgi:hypothetical protein
MKGIVLVFLAAWPALAAPPETSPPAGNLPGASPLPTVAAPGSVSALDLPLRLAADAAATYQRIADYTCVFIKRERIRGQLQPDQVMTMRVRTHPFSVYLFWNGPPALKGQEACYVQGRNNGMVRVHATGVRGAFGFVSLDPQDARVLEDNRHPITEAGIGHLIERTLAFWQKERWMNQTQVRIADYEYNKRKCTRVEMIHPALNTGQFYAFRTVIYFDKENHLPIRVEAYDWPHPGGPPQGDLLESYSYVDLRFNVGLSEQAFHY